MKINENLTQSDVFNIDVISQLEHQIQFQQIIDSGWIFDKIISMRIKFYETDDLSGSTFVKIPLRPSAILKIKKTDKYCFI